MEFRQEHLEQCSLEDSLHPLHCPNLHGFRVTRHDMIVDELATFLRTMCPRAQVIRNPVINTTDTGHKTVADIQFVLDAHTTNIDVTVSFPGSMSYLADTKEDLLTNIDRACDARTTAKMALYRQHCPTEALNNLVIFALDSTGRLGKAAQSFLDKVTGLAQANTEFSEHNQRQRRTFLRRVSTICVKGAALEIKTWRQTVRVETNTTLTIDESLRD